MLLTVGKCFTPVDDAHALNSEAARMAHETLSSGRARKFLLIVLSERKSASETMGCKPICHEVTEQPAERHERRIILACLEVRAARLRNGLSSRRIQPLELAR